MSRQHLILLGYEVGVGEGVTISLGHTAVVGITQQSGKTTTLESLAHRAGRQVLAFVTKRGEGSFGAAPGHNVRSVPPYFRERADWQFVEAVLEATMRERMKYDRQWIMKISQGARTLHDVRRNASMALDKARGEFMKGVYEKLIAYLDIVVPQMAQIRWAPSVHLHPCLNVMNLGDMSSELQGLVIASCLDYVMENLKDTIVIVPEAWEFIPRGRKSPVTLSAEAFARKGAALRNFLWIDSQDLAGVHTPILKQVSVWLLGVQREINEVKRTLAHVPSVPKKLKPEDITTLGLGQFYAVERGHATKTYVSPWWMDENEARAIALDGLVHIRSAQVRPTVLHVADPRPDPPGTWTGFKTAEEHMDAQLKDENDRLKARTRQLEDEILKLRQQIEKGLRETAAAIRDPELGTGPVPKDGAWGSSYGKPDVLPAGNPLNDLDYWPLLKSRILADSDVLVAVAKLQVQRPEILIEVTRNTVTMNSDSLQGRIAKLIGAGFLNDPVRANVINKELNRTGGEVHSGNLNKALVKMRLDGYVTREGDEWQKSPALKVTTRELQAVV